MVLRDTWSRRKRLQEQDGHGDIFTYNNLPQPLRIQIVNLLRGTIGGDLDNSDNWAAVYGSSSLAPSIRVWSQLTYQLADDFGLPGLGQHQNSLRNFYEFFMQCQDIDWLLDCVELAFRYIDRVVRHWTFHDRQRSGTNIPPDDAIAQLNARFLEHRVGYQFESGRIVKIDNQMLHSKVVIPALQLLSDPTFSGANQEFLSALEHLRYDRPKEALREAANAFESTMKIICDNKCWNYKSTANASQLIGVIFDNDLIPPYLQSEFTGLKSVLSSGAPNVRNNSGAHGEGSTPLVVPNYLASYVINFVAANIVLLVSAFHGSP